MSRNCFACSQLRSIDLIRGLSVFFDFSPSTGLSSPGFRQGSQLPGDALQSACLWGVVRFRRRAKRHASTNLGRSPWCMRRVSITRWTRPLTTYRSNNFWAGAGAWSMCCCSGVSGRNTPAMEAFLISTSVVALAEMGDKTQLLALVLAARFRKPWPWNLRCSLEPDLPRYQQSTRCT